MRFFIIFIFFFILFGLYFFVFCFVLFVSWPILKCTVVQQHWSHFNSGWWRERKRKKDRKTEMKPSVSSPGQSLRERNKVCKFAHFSSSSSSSICVGYLVINQRERERKRIRINWRRIQVGGVGGWWEHCASNRFLEHCLVKMWKIKSNQTERMNQKSNKETKKQRNQKERSRPVENVEISEKRENQWKHFGNNITVPHSPHFTSQSKTKAKKKRKKMNYNQKNIYMNII